MSNDKKGTRALSSLWEALVPTSIKKKIILIVITLYGLMLLVVLASYGAIRKIDQKVYYMSLFDKIDRQILEIRRYEKTYLLYRNKADLIYALDYLVEVEWELKAHSDEFAKLGIKDSLIKLDYLLKRYDTLITSLLEKGENNKKLEREIRREGRKITNLFENIRAVAITKLNEDIQFYSSVPIIIFLIVLVVIAFTAYFMSKWILEPIEYVTLRAREISAGNLRHIPKCEGFFVRCQECDQLIDALNKMLEAIEAKQEQLIQATKMAAIGTALSGIAHEINNPLNNIFLTTEVIMENLDSLSKEELLEMLQDIYNEGERAKEIVGHLLEFSRSKKQFQMEPVSLNRLVEESLRIMANQIKMAGVELETEIPEKSLTILGNFNQLQQVLVNIIVNAIQAMENGGRLTVRLYQENSQGVIEISDTGPGIPEEVRKKIFDPFFTTKEKGTGLGLSVSYSIVKKHKGDILVDSRPGQGTTFKIVLPLWE